MELIEIMRHRRSIRKYTGEAIPTCFFNLADPERKREGYKIEDFAKVVLG